MSQELEGTLTNSADLVGTFGSEGGSGTSNYNDLINKPSINSVTLQGNKTASQLGFSAVATSGAYSDLTGTPTIPAAQVNSDWNASSGVAEILNKPTLSAVATSGSYDDLTNKPSIPAAQVNSDWNAVSGVAEILNKPNLSAVATSGDYDDLTNKPTIPAAQVNSDWNAVSGVAQILNKPTLSAVATSGAYSDLTGTPTIPTLNDFIKVTSVIGTTSGGGVLSRTFAHNLVILSAWASIDNCIVDIYKDGANFDNTGSLTWNFYCHNATGQSWGNTNLTIRMAYIDYNE